MNDELGVRKLHRFQRLQEHAQPIADAERRSSQLSIS